MEQRFTFIKTNEVKEDFDSEERVEVEVVMEDNDLGQLEEKFSNFLKGCGYENISVSITEPRIEEDSDHLGDLDDELEDIDCLLYTSPSPRDCRLSRMPSSA